MVDLRFWSCVRSISFFPRPNHIQSFILQLIFDLPYPFNCIHSPRFAAGLSVKPFHLRLSPEHFFFEEGQCLWLHLCGVKSRLVTIYLGDYPYDSFLCFVEGGQEYRYKRHPLWGFFRLGIPQLHFIIPHPDFVSFIARRDRNV